MVIYYHHVLFYITMKYNNVLVGVVPNVHSFRDIILDSFTVLIKDMVVPDLFLHYLGKGIQEFTKPEEVNSTFVTFLMILHAFSKINGHFFADPLHKNHRSRARTADRKREEVCLHPYPGVGSQRILILFREILGLLIFYVLTVYTILVVVGGQDFSNILIIVKI